MKKVIYSVVLTILVLYILLFPGPAVKAASFGLTLWYTRLLPTLLDYVRIFGKLPEHLIFSFAAIIEFHKGKRGDQDIALKDDPSYLAFWHRLWAEFDGDYLAMAKKVLAWEEAWDMDMNTIHPEIAEKVASRLEDIDKNGMRDAVERFVNG